MQYIIPMWVLLAIVGLWAMIYAMIKGTLHSLRDLDAERFDRHGPDDKETFPCYNCGATGHIEAPPSPDCAYTDEPFLAQPDYIDCPTCQGTGQIEIPF